MRRIPAACATALMLAASPAIAAGNDWLALTAHQAYDPDARAYFSALSTYGCTAPTSAFKAAVNSYVINKKAALNWNYQSTRYIFMTTDSCTASVNLMQPLLYRITWSGSCTYTVATGLNGDSSTCYGDPGVNANAYPRLSQNNSHIDAWVAANKSNVMGIINTNGTIELLNLTNRVTRITTATNITDTGGGTAGYVWADRTDSSHATTGVNTTILSNAVASTSGAPTAAHIVIGRNNAAFFTNSTNMLFAGWGGALADETQEYNDLNTLRVAIQSGGPPDPDQCVPSTCLPSYFTGSGAATNQATVNAGAIQIAVHAPLPRDNTITESTYKYFPFTIAEGANNRSNLPSTYSNGGGVAYFEWVYRSTGGDATRSVLPNPVTPILYYTTGAGKQLQCLVPESSIANAMTAAYVRTAYAIGNAAHIVGGAKDGQGYLDLATAGGFADDHVLFYDSTDGTPNLSDQIQTLCTDTTTWPGYAALPNNYIVLSYGRVSDLATTPKEVTLDWEPQEGRTCAQTTATITTLASITHNAGYALNIYTNPLDAGTSPYNGWCRNGDSGANLDTVLGLLNAGDHFGLMLLDANKIGSVADELAYALAGFASPTYSKLMLIPLISKVTVADAQYVRAQAVANSYGRIDIFLNGAVPGGQCSRPTNEKIAALTGLTAC